MDEENEELSIAVACDRLKCFLTVGRANTEQTVLSWPVKAATWAFVLMSHT
jgi:hypothetical protein